MFNLEHYFNTLRSNYWSLYRSINFISVLDVGFGLDCLIRVGGQPGTNWTEKSQNVQTTQKFFENISQSVWTNVKNRLISFKNRLIVKNRLIIIKNANNRLIIFKNVKNRLIIKLKNIQKFIF